MRAALLHPRLVTALVLGALASCSSNKPPPAAPDAGPTCSIRADCEALGAGHRGEICSLDGHCVGCGSDGDCALQERCDPEKRRCGFRSGWGADCTLNAECLAGQLCVQGLCVAESQVALCHAGTCEGSGQRCNPLNHVCEEDLGCLSDADCSAVELCHLPIHACVTRCMDYSADVVCEPGQRCLQGRCSDCAGPLDCPGGLVCDFDRLECVSDGTARCLTSRDCPAGLFCNPATGFCTPAPPPCSSSEDCQPGQRCEIATGRCLARACPPDRFEPNSDASGARSLGAGTLEDLTLCDREQDWFAIALTRGDRLSLFVDADSLLEPFVSVRMLDSTGRRLAQGGLALDRVASADGTYDVVLQSTDLFVPYGLRVMLSRGEPCDDDAFEPNDEASSAKALAVPSEVGALTLCPFDADLFSVDVPAGHGLKAELEYEPAAGEVEFRLVASGTGQVLASADAATAHQSLEVASGQAGGSTVRIEVLPKASEIQTSYLLRTSLLP